MKKLIVAVLFALLTVPVAHARDTNETEQFIGLMSQYLQLSDQVVDLAARREAAIFLAVEGIFEVYEQRKDAPGAIKHLERILNDSNNLTVRNIVRMKLRDVYKETGQSDKALEQLDLIIRENSA